MASIKNNGFEIIRRPRITEKAAMAGSVDNSVIFEVHPKANKVEIARAIEQIFDVKVKSVRVANYRGKEKRVGRQVGTRGDWKKAYISLKEGKIEVIEGL